jgi:hypothetical protein
VNGRNREGGVRPLVEGMEGDTSTGGDCGVVEDFDGLWGDEWKEWTFLGIMIESGAHPSDGAFWIFLVC